MHEKKKVVKQIYVVKRDGRKDTSLDLNTIDEKLINVLKTSAIDGKGKEKLSVDIPSVKSEQSKPYAKIYLFTLYFRYTCSYG